MHLLVAQVQTLGDAQITLVVGFAQVGEQAAALTNHFEQTSATRLIFFVGAQVIGQLLDASRQNGDLNFGRARIRAVTMIVADEFGLDFFREWHDVCCFLSLVYAGLRARSL